MHGLGKGFGTEARRLLRKPEGSDPAKWMCSLGLGRKRTLRGGGSLPLAPTTEGFPFRKGEKEGWDSVGRGGNSWAEAESDGRAIEEHIW